MRWWLGLLVFCGAIAPFAAAAGAGFVNWDDDILLLTNDRYRGFGAEQLGFAFGSAFAGHYQPLTWLTFTLDHALWGLDPGGFHRTSLLWHGGNAVAVLLLLHELVRHARGPRLAAGGCAQAACALGALLFAVHPLRVESVAWITERRDLVAGFFAVLTVWCWLRAHRADALRARWLAAAHGAFVLGLLGKASGMTLPLVLLVLDVWPLRRRPPGTGWRRLLVEKTPMLLIAAVFAAVALQAQTAAGARVSFADHPPAARALQAAYGLWFYTSRTIAPVDLSPLYPLERALDVAAPRFVLSALGVVAAAAALVAARRRWPAPAAAGAAFAVLAAPMLGFAQVGPQLVADRYSYLPCLPFAALAAGWASGCRRPAVAVAALGLAVVALVPATVRQTAVWHDSRSLWEHTLRLQPDSFNAHYHHGRALAAAGETEGALAEYRRTVELQPREPKAWAAIGSAEFRRGRFAEAFAAWRAAHDLQPAVPDHLHGLAIAAFELGRYEECVAWCDRCHAAAPAWPHSWPVLGDALLGLGRRDAARAAFERAAACDPGNAAIRQRLAELR